MPESAAEFKKIVITGQSGINKKEYVNHVMEFCKDRKTRVFDFGEAMYKEAARAGAKIDPGKILSLPLLRLNMIRRSVFKDLIRMSEKESDCNILVSTHSCFRWERGLFHTFDSDLLSEFDPQIYVTLIDDVDAVNQRLATREDPHAVDFSLKDIMVWREEEIITTEMIALAQGKPHYVLPRLNPPDTISKLMFSSNLRKAYLSFPITKVRDKPEIVKRIQEFRNEMASKLIVFDPYTIQEKRLLVAAHEAQHNGSKEIEIETCGKPQKLKTDDILAIEKDIDGQIISRDFKLIDQSDIIVAFIPEVKGEPDISAGVQSEIQFGHDLPRAVYVIWPSEKDPSVWVQKMATKVFQGEGAFDEVLELFHREGFLVK
jgi:adenylate kinase